MNRFSKNQVNVSNDDMRAFAVSLRKTADMLDLMAKLSKDSDMEGVQAKSLITGIDGLTLTARFVGYIATAYINELSARGVGDIAGALHELQKQNKLFEALREKEVAKIEQRKGRKKE
jgi:hypothetical protein